MYHSTKLKLDLATSSTLFMFQSVLEQKMALDCSYSMLSFQYQIIMYKHTHIL